MPVKKDGSKSNRKPTKSGKTLQWRSEGEIIRDEIIIANMLFQGARLSDMPAILQERTGAEYALAVNTISETIRNLSKRWQEKALIKVDEIKNRELIKLDALEDEYWRAWHRSCMPKEDLEIVMQRATDINDLPILTAPMVETQNRIKKYTRDGAAKYLEGVERCIDKRCKLLGLYAPIKVSGNGIDGFDNETYDLPLNELQKRLVAVIQNVQINIDNRSLE